MAVFNQPSPHPAVFDIPGNCRREPCTSGRGFLCQAWNGRPIQQGRGRCRHLNRTKTIINDKTIIFTKKSHETKHFSPVNCVTSIWSYAGATSTMSAPTMHNPFKPRSKRKTSRDVMPPGSRVPVP